MSIEMAAQLTVEQALKCVLVRVSFASIGEIGE
jgi:hypothetical protein